jgi:hypothetical protein
VELCGWPEYEVHLVNRNIVSPCLFLAGAVFWKLKQVFPFSPLRVKQIGIMLLKNRHMKFKNGKSLTALLGKSCILDREKGASCFFLQCR